MEDTEREREEKEKRADRFADTYFMGILPLKYRQLSAREMFIYQMEDGELLVQARKIAHELRK